MSRLLRLFFGLFSRCVSSRHDLILENLALRQQLAVLKARHPQPRFAVRGSGQALLGALTPLLGQMERCVDRSTTRDDRWMA